MNSRPSRPQQSHRHSIACLAACLSLCGYAYAQNPPSAAPSSAPSTSNSPASAAAPTTSPTPAQPTSVTLRTAAQPGRKPVSHRHELEAANAYLAGSALLDKHDPEKALAQFQRAVKLDPTKTQYALAAAIAQENVVTDMVHRAELLRSTGDAKGADNLLAAAAKLDPDNRIVTQQLPVEVQESQLKILPVADDSRALESLGPPLELKPNNSVHSYHLRADAHEMLRKVMLDYGIQCEFNADVPTTSTRIDIDNVSYSQISPVLEMMTHAFLVPLDPQHALVVKDTQENRQQYGHVSMESIYMPGVGTTATTEMVSMLTEVLGIEHAVANPNAGVLTLRGSPAMLKIANYELASMLDGGSEVVLEMKVYELDKTHSTNVGLDVTSSITAFNIYSQATQIIGQYQSQIQQAIASGLLPASATPLQIVEALFGAGLLNNNPLISNGILGTFGGGLTYTGVTANSLPSINFGLNESEAKSVDNVQLRVFNGATATFQVGSKYPIVTSTYTSGGISSSALAGVSSSQFAALGLNATSAAAAAASVSVPQIQYEDLGLTLKATPVVLGSGSVRIAIDLKIEALGGSTLDGNPILSSRALTSTVTVAQNEAAVIESAMSKQESNAVSGLPGLSELPGFGDTTDSDKELDTSELVITLTPRIVRSGMARFASRPIAMPSDGPREQADGDQ